MANVIAFEIRLNGVRQVITNTNELTTALKVAQQTANTSTFGSRQFTEANIALNRLKTTLAQLRAENKLQQNAIVNLTSTNAGLREASARVLQLRNQFTQLSTSDQLGAVGQKLNLQLAEAQSRLRQIQTQLNTANVTGSRIINTTQARQTGRALGSIIPNSGTGGTILGQVGTAIAGVSPIGAIAAAAALATAKIVSLNAEVDDLLGVLQKTGSLTRDQAQALIQPLIDLDTRTALTDLLKIGEVLGKLGVDINAQTIGAVDQLNVALSDEFEGGAEQVTNTIGKLKQILSDFKGVEASDAFLRIGNALNVLGASGAATAPVIANFASRIGGVSGPLGVTASQIFGTAAALEELGTASERGSSGFNRIIAKLASAPEKFASVLGITDEAVKSVNASATSFADLVNKDIFAAFTLVLQRLRDLNLGATDFRNTLSELKIKGQSESEVLGKLSQSYELLQSRVALANDALQNNNSITKEFEVRNNTLQGQLDKLGNTISESFISSGFTDWLRDVVGSLNEWIGASNTIQDTLAKEYINLNSLVTQATLYNTTTEERARLIGQLQEEYPEYFANLDQEKVSNEELTAVLRQANDAYARRFGLIELQTTFTKAQEKQGKRQAELAKAQVALLETLGVSIANYERETGQAFQRTGDLVKDAQNIIDKGFAARPSLFRSLQGDLSGFLLAQEALNGATIKAAKEQDIYTKSVQLFAKAEFEATQAALQRVQRFKEESLQQKELILQLANAGRNTEAQEKLTQLQFTAAEALRITSTRDINFISDLADAQLSAVGKQAKAVAAEVAKISTDTDLLLKGVGRPNLPDPDDKRGTGRASTKAETERRQAEAELQRFNDAVIRLQKQLDDLRDDAISRQADDRREIVLAKEKRRYDEQLIKIKEGEEAIKKAQEDAQKDLRESVEASQNEVNKLRSAGVTGTRLDTALKRLQKAQEDEKQSTIVFEKAKNEILSKSYAAQRELLTEHLINVKKINVDFDNKDAKDREKAQAASFKALQNYYDQLATESEQRENDLRKQLLQERVKQQEEASKTLTGKVLLVKLDAIDFEFDQKDLAAERNVLERQLEQLEQQLSEAIEFNKLSLEVNGKPAFNQDDLDKLKDQISKVQEEITNIEQREAAKRVKNKKDEVAQKIKEEQRYKNEFRDLIFDIARETVETQFALRKSAVERERKLQQEAVEREFEGRLNAVERNAIETERVEKELAKKKLEIDRNAAEKQREIAVSQAIINGSLAILKAYATLDPISASIAALGIGVLTTLQIAKINDQEFYHGGFTGPAKSTQRKDKKNRNIAGVVHTNEYVMPEKVLKTKRGRALAYEAEKMRLGFGMSSIPGSYAEGGFTQPAPISPASNTAVFINVQLSDEQMNDLAIRVGEGARAGAYQGTKIGQQDYKRLAEREESLTERTKI